MMRKELEKERKRRTPRWFLNSKRGERIAFHIEGLDRRRDEREREREDIIKQWEK